MRMALKVYINGKLYEKEDAKISVYDHGLLYGDGVFEGLRSYAGKVFRLEQHLQRLWDSAKAIWLEIPLSREALASADPSTRWPPTTCATPISAWSSPAGPARLGLDPNRTSNPQVIIITDHISLYPEELLSQRAGNHHGQHASATTPPRSARGSNRSTI